MEYDVYGIGNPLMDMIFFVTDNDVAALGLRKGSMNLIDESTRKRILDHFKGKKFDTCPAGDCPNTMRGVAALGGKAVFSGKVADDETGRLYISSLEREGVISEIHTEKGTTGTSIIMVTPDKERTMATFLGNCRLYTKADVSAITMQKSKYLYITGYMWDTENQKQAFHHAIEQAHRFNTKIVFNFADHFVVTNNKRDFEKLINHVDIIICNEAESTVITGGEHHLLKRGKCSTAIVTLGDKGSSVYHHDSVYQISPNKVECVDTTGAGDMYAAGLIYGLSQGMDIVRAAGIGSYFASRIVCQIGTRIPPSVIEEIKERTMVLASDSRA